MLDLSTDMMIKPRVLVSLHNSLLSAILLAASTPLTTHDPSSQQGPPRKKRRLLPHQDPPPALNRWVLGMGKSERSRVKNAAMKKGPAAAARSIDSEALREKPIRTLPEGNSRPGAHVALPLSSLTRTLPTIQHLTSRMDLIAAQHQMTASKPAASLLAAAVEAYLKQLTMHALATTSTSHPFASITPSEPVSNPPLSVSSFHTLFTIAPFENPAPTASMTRLMMLNGGREEADEYQDEEVYEGATTEATSALGRYDAGTRQIVKMLMGRDGVREMVKGGMKPKGMVL
ncbi:hypothetical protein FRC03_008587 [Tulasnella sp. 419]|nr:hypothetical protein FRC03_008587 [Tulasnella sp. 419]